MKKIYFLIIFIFINPLHLFSQIIGGYIPEALRVDWSLAGLRSDLTQSTAQFIYDVTQEPGFDPDHISCDAQVQSALQKARTDAGPSIIYFPPGYYYIWNTIELICGWENGIFIDDSNTIFLGAGSENTSLVFMMSETQGFRIKGYETVVPENGQLITQSLEKGSNIIYTTNWDGNNYIFSPGDWVHFYEQDFPLMQWNEDSNNYNFVAAVGQIDQVNSVTNSSLELQYAASKTYYNGYN